ncbi:MAG TPA: hypothetical protein VJN43_13545 [Bryobacteraceae bacterium]|nr:hypothetical protein [Bryobacteraceae bacterium]
MRTTRWPLFALALCGFVHAEDAAAIMAKVAANQDRAQQMRSAFVYHQSVLIRFQRGNGKLAREEQREYTVTPTAASFAKELTHFAGKYENHGQYIDYDKPGYEYKDVDIDGELANDMASDLVNDNTRDGLARDVFPLTTKELPKYTFRLGGKENYRGVEVFKITFKPKKRTALDPETGDESSWAGEALIDAREFQPVLVTTWLAQGVPVAVQVLLGTNLKHLGFKVAYKKFDEGLWFPVTYGGEFQVRALFLYKRTIALSMVNSGFQRADVSSVVSFGLPVIP